MSSRVAARWIGRLATRPIRLPEAHIRGLSKFIAQQIEQKAGSGGLPRSVLITSIQIPDVKGNRREIHVHVMGVPNHKTMVSGRAARSKAGEPVVELWIDSGIQPNRGLEVSVHEVLMHELTHAIDVIVPVKRSPKAPEDGVPIHKDDLPRYFNRPTEIRAYMGQIARPMIESMREYMEGGATARESFDMALADDPAWAMIKPWLTASNKARMLKGLWTAVEDAGFGKQAHGNKLSDDEVQALRRWVRGDHLQVKIEDSDLCD